MFSISNIKIGKQIALILGGNVLLLAGLSALSLWAIRTSEGVTADVKDRQAKAYFVEVIVTETLALGQNSGRIVVAKKATDDLVSQIMASRNKRLRALADFTAVVHTPPSMKQAAELSQLVKASAATNDHIITLVRAGKFAEVPEAFRVLDITTAASVLHCEPGAYLRSLAASY